MKRLCCLLSLFFSFTAYAQFSVEFIVRNLPPYHHNQDTIYIAGNFNRWNPKDSNFIFLNSHNSICKKIKLKAGKYEYKLTKGGWEKVEAGQSGTAIENRVVEISTDTTIYIDVAHWSDHFPKPKRMSTASKNVKIVNNEFFMPQLGRNTRIVMYLPESYHTTKKKYPVIYMHDGQNVFDEATSFSGEWGVDETLDSLGNAVGESIVVAIDNGAEQRINEYSPYDMPEYGEGKGDQYVDFIVHTLMPFINRNYRTKTKAKHTTIAGSSMGGLISFYAILKYPDVFGNAGVFSPAFWVAPAVRDVIPEMAKKVKGKIYFYAGMNENETMVPDMLSVFEEMQQHSKAVMTTNIRSEGKHSEWVWRQEFPLFYVWLNTR